MRFLWPAVLLAIAPGCLSLPGERPLPVQVIDAETKQPIHSANIQVAYAFAQPTWSTHPSAASAGSDGVARLWVADADHSAVTLEVAAMGYLTEEKPVTAETVDGLDPPHVFESTDRRAAVAVVELYAEPRPTVDLVLPAGFRGHVRATVQVQDDATGTPGVRQFVYQVTDTGTVDVVGSPILHRAFAPDFRLRYGDGTPLTQNAKESEIGYWWLRKDGDVQVFLVGTKSDFDAAVRAGEAPSVGRTNGGSGGGKGGGGGRHGGRRGGGGM